MVKKHWNNKFYYTVASCPLFLYDLYSVARIHYTSSWKWIIGLPHTRQIYLKQMLLIVLRQLILLSLVLHKPRSFWEDRTATLSRQEVGCPDILLDDIRDMLLMGSPCVVMMDTVHYVYSHLHLFSGVNWGKLDTHRDVHYLWLVWAETELMY